MIVSFGLIPNETTAKKIEMWISEELPKHKDDKPVDLSDLEF